jgi:Transposase DDE domain
MVGVKSIHPTVKEAAMKAPRGQQSKPPSPQRSLRMVLQDFLTPALWKQAHQHRQKTRRNKSSRWTTQPLVLVLLFMTWCSGDSQAERFEIAKAYCQVAWLAKRRGPGKTVAGFQKALARLPLAVLRTIVAGVRQVLVQRLGLLWFFEGFVPIGCDGSRVTCPRTPELERRLGAAGKNKSAPSLWVTALVHLRWGVPLAWRFGRSNADERAHLRRLLGVLPRQALLVADAGYVGFLLTHCLVQNQVMFLLRMCSNARLYTETQVALEHFREGIVYYWPSEKDEKAGAAPLRLRLIRIRARRRNNDVWLLTNVLDEQRLPLSLAGQMFRWRWQSEGCFRNYKYTVKKVKLVSRSLRLVHREAEGSWLALQLLLAQGVLAQQQRAVQKAAASTPPQGQTAEPCEQPPETRLYSPRKIVVAIRKEMSGSRKRGELCYGERLQQARGEERPGRTSAKASRKWPRRKPHQPPKPPQLLMLSDAQKSLLARLRGDAA